MSAEADESAADESATEDLRIGRPTIHGRRDFEMDVIGWGIFIILIVLMLPLLPALVLVVIVAKLLRLGTPRRLSWGDTGPRVDTSSQAHP